MEGIRTLHISSRSSVTDLQTPACAIPPNLSMTGSIEKAIAFALSDREASNPAPAQQKNVSADQASTPAQSGPSAGLVVQMTPKRRVHVVTNRERDKATKWMIEDAQLNGERRIISRTVGQFPHIVKGNTKANLGKASLWSKKRNVTMALLDTYTRSCNFTSSVSGGLKRATYKTAKGRGLKRFSLVIALYMDLLSEFERVKSLGVKFSCAVLQILALSLLASAEEESPYYSGTEFTFLPLNRKITIRWIQHFMQAHKIVLQSQTGKLMKSPEKQLDLERHVPFYLGELKRGFEAGLLNEDNVANADETHFVFNMDKGRNLGFEGATHVKYAELVSGSDPITMMVSIIEGRNATIQPPMLMFRNANRSYPIQRVPDEIPGVSYCSSPKGWMDAITFEKWLCEPRAIKRLLHYQRLILYVDNCSGHKMDSDTAAALQSIGTTLQKFPPNATHLVQPADSFIIQKIKDAWRRRWDEYKMECIRNNTWTVGSGKLPNSGKVFYLKPAYAALKEINQQRESNGVQYARRAMIMTGMSLNLNGRWEEGQLSNELQSIVAKHWDYLDGKPVD